MALKTKRAVPAPEAGRTEGEAGTESFFPIGWLISSYLILSILFFLPALLPGVQIFGTDYLAVAYMWEEFVTQQFARGELPKWLPYVYGGAPFFANPMDTYYPVTLVLRLLGIPTYKHLGLLFVVQYFLAGLGGYLLLRELGARRMPSYLAGLLYMFSGYLISFIYGGHDGRAIVATLAPLFLFALHRGIRTGGWRWFVLAGVVIGLAMLSFQIQSSYYLLLAGGLWAVFALWVHGLFGQVGALVRRLAGGALTLAIGFSMAAVNFIPFLGYVAASPRGGAGGRGYEYATSWSMPPREIVGLAVPEWIGILGNYWGENPIKLHTEYVGALVLLLAVVGVYLLRRNRYHWFFIGLAVFALSMSFGGHTPIYRLYYALLPGVDKFRAPSISFYLVTLSLVAIAGLVLDRLQELRRAAKSRSASERREAERLLRTVGWIGAGALAATTAWGLIAAAVSPPPPAGDPATLEAYRAMLAAANRPEYVRGVWRFALFLVLSAGAGWLWIRGTFNTRVAGVLLAAIATIDLWIVDKRFFETVEEPSVYFAPDEVAQFLMAQPGPFRTFVLFDLPQDDYLTLFGLELIGGEHGNQLHSYNEFLGAGESSYTDYHNIVRYPSFLAMANARYLVTQQAVNADFLDPVFQGRTRTGRTAIVYENRDALPRAYLVPAASRAEDRDAALERMRSSDFDPAREVVLYDEPTVAAADPDAFAGRAEVVRHEPHVVVVRLEANDAGYLVLSDNYYPDWRVTVNGEPAPLLRANHTFRAVPVAAGEHVVEFRFEPRSLTIGFSISLAVWIGLLLYWGGVLWWDRRRQTLAPEPA